MKSLLTPDQVAAGPIWGGIAIGGTLLGWGLSGLVGAVLADCIGRRRMMLWSVASTGWRRFTKALIQIVSLVSRFLVTKF